MDDSTEYAEQSLIGAVLLGGRDVLEDVSVKPEDFSNVRHELMWSLFLSMAQRGTQIDLTTTFAALRTADEVTRRNINPVWMHETMANTPSSSSAGHYAGIVKTEAMRRNVTRAASKITQAAQEMEPEDLVDFARGEIEQAADADVYQVRPMSVTAPETIAALREEPSHMPSPWESLNDVIGGFRPGALYVIGARPGSGKTIVGLQAALEMTKHGAVMFSTLEMGEPEMQMRVFAQQAHIPLNKLIDSQLSQAEWARLEDLAHPSWESLYIQDSPTQTAESIRMTARTISRRRPLACVVVDYLQLMEGNAPRGVKRHELVAQWSRKLKLMAKSLHVPVLAMSQLNRESGDGSLPKLSDLRESGAIEQDADVVILLSRDDKNLGDLAMQVAKNRHGARSNLRMSWWGSYSMITDPWVKSPTLAA